MAVTLTENERAVICAAYTRLDAAITALVGSTLVVLPTSLADSLLIASEDFDEVLTKLEVL